MITGAMKELIANDLNLACRRLANPSQSGEKTGGQESRFASHFTSQQEMDCEETIEVPKLSSRIKIESVTVFAPGRHKRTYTLRN